LENKIIIAGGGHAGIEAALAIAKMGFSCTIVTLNSGAIGRMSCNPAIGGLAKGHLVREIDALGGIMGKVADKSTIQNKILNKSKGRAVWSPRSQVDKIKYTKIAQELIFKNDKISIIEDEVVDFEHANNVIVCATLKSAGKIKCKSLIITCGTFMSGLIHIGNKNYKGGRMGEKRSYGLTESLKNKGFSLGRLKTGTPPRANKNSINFNELEIAAGEKIASPFSMFTPKPFKPKNIPCYLAYTSKKTHKIIKENIHLSSMFAGNITGVGARYCPSVEDKIIRFADRDRHQLFLEPEWEGANQYYINGFSTSLPEEIQISALRTIKGLEKINLIRPGYAIEYDYLPSYQLKSSLETKKIKGLFCAGQINGTSGYEEAAAQGLIAGINSSHYVENFKPLILPRSSSYIGVLIDDLITKHIDEPYRMFTSRAENRLFLRADTAGLRLCEIGIKNNMLADDEKDIFIKFKAQYKELYKKILKTKLVYNDKPVFLKDLLKRPEINITKLNSVNVLNLLKPYDDDVVFSVETAIKYEGYEHRELDRIAKIKKLDNLKIPPKTNYQKITNLSTESIEKLLSVKPETLGQASRIAGVRPSDIAVLSIFLISHK
jgi:tRNA uridine 5-carboxymethylaminomethyl modification enzyme